MNETDWQKMAQFWQMKYFELLGHSNSVIAALGRDQVLAAKEAQQAAINAMRAAEGNQQS